MYAAVGCVADATNSYPSIISICTSRYSITVVVLVLVLVLAVNPRVVGVLGKVFNTDSKQLALGT